MLGNARAWSDQFERCPGTQPAAAVSGHGALGDATHPARGGVVHHHVADPAPPGHLRDRPARAAGGGDLAVPRPAPPLHRGDGPPAQRVPLLTLPRRGCPADGSRTAPPARAGSAAGPGAAARTTSRRPSGSSAPRRARRPPAHTRGGAAPPRTGGPARAAAPP